MASNTYLYTSNKLEDAPKELMTMQSTKQVTSNYQRAAHNVFKNGFAHSRKLFALTKPTITLLVVVTAVPTLLIAPAAAHVSSFLWIGLLALLGTGLASASASVFNHLIDRDIDEIMVRTRKRPVASGHVSVPVAFTWGAFLGALSLIVLYAAHPLAAIVGFLANAFYVLIYTLILKRSTDQNIVIGGAAGAVGPLIGWAAMSGTLGWEAWMLFALIFLWTPPHFWALAIKYQDDYKQAGIPMRPVTAGNQTTRREIFLYTLPLLPCCLALSLFGKSSWFFGLVATYATWLFIKKAWILYRTADNKLAMPVFHYSCIYLFIIFGALTIDALIVDHLVPKAAAADSSIASPPASINPAPLSAPKNRSENTSVIAKNPDYSNPTEFTDNSGVRLEKTIYGAQSGEIIVQFSSGVVPQLPITIRPLKKAIRMRRQQPSKVEFEFVNLSDQKIEIQAIHRLRPSNSESHLKKLACFCFEKQTLKPFQKQIMPVVLTLDDQLPWDLTALNLHYTVFPASASISKPTPSAS